MKLQPQKTVDQGLNGVINIYDKLPIEFTVKRMFTVTNITSNEYRGNHANKKTNQYMICLNNFVEVQLITIDNRVFTEILNPGQIIFIPAKTWVKYRNFIKNGNEAGIPITCSVAVVCDQLYDANEYYTNFDEFKADIVEIIPGKPIANGM